MHSNDFSDYMVKCPFGSNTNYGPPSVANVSCPTVVGPRGYQVFLIELWSRKTKPDVRLLGIDMVTLRRWAPFHDSKGRDDGQVPGVAAHGRPSLGA